MAIETHRIQRWRRMVLLAMPTTDPLTAREISTRVGKVDHPTPYNVVIRSLRDMREAGMVELVGKHSGWRLTEYGAEAQSMVSDSHLDITRRSDSCWIVRGWTVSKEAVHCHVSQGVLLESKGGGAGEFVPYRHGYYGLAFTEREEAFEYLVHSVSSAIKQAELSLSTYRDTLDRIERQRDQGDGGV